MIKQRTPPEPEKGRKHTVCAAFRWLFFFLLLPAVLPAQMMLDTLQLQEMEIISVLALPLRTATAREMDSLAKKDTRQDNLASLLENHSLIFIKSYGRGGLATAAFRGTAASHTQVLWNGFPINSPMLGQVDLSQVPNVFFDKASLRYGGSSLESVPGALGGSIELTNSLDADAPVFSFSQLAGSFHTSVTDASFRLQAGKLLSETRGMLQYSENDFPYYNNALLPPRWMDQEHAQVFNTGFSQRFTYRLSGKQQISLVSWNQWNGKDIPPVMTNVEKGGEPTETQDDFFSRNVLSWVYHAERTVWSVNGAWFHQYQHYFLQTSASDGSTDTLIDSRNRSDGYFAKLKTVSELGKGFRLTAGADLRSEVVRTGNYDATRYRTSAGLFARLEKRFFDRLETDLLLRQELADGKLLQPMPFLGLAFQLLKARELYLRANVSGNYHLPTLNDLYWVPGGNPDLLPERALEGELGLHYRLTGGNKLSLESDLSLFASRINDWIQWKPGTYSYWIPENIARVFARGLEAGLQLDAVPGRLSYHLRAAYAFTRTTDESREAGDNGYAGNQLIYVPVHKANALAAIAFGGFTAQWSVLFTGERKTTMNSGDSFPDVLPSYWLHNLSLGKSWTLQHLGLELKFRLRNIFNVGYQAILWRAMPGTNFDISLRIQIPGKS